MSFSQRAGGCGSSYSSPASSTKEFSLQVLKVPEIKYQMMKFNSNLNIDFGKWNQAKLDRDINRSDGKSVEELMPKFGAGSEFGRESRQEARRKRYGGNKKLSESNPWLLKIGGKKFRGVREGGVTDNSSYYLFTHGENNVINAHKLDEWYNFQPIQRYKTLTVEEAEMEFGRRNKVMNHFTLMLQKRLKAEKDGDEDEEEVKTKSSFRKTKELKISEMDEWNVSDDESDDEDEEIVDKKKKKEKKNQTKSKPKKKVKGSDESAFEESDDGDEEGRELDYISDSSDNVSNDEEKTNTEMKGVSEEKGLKSLLTSDEEEELNEKKNEVTDDVAQNVDLETDTTKKEDNKPKLVSTNKIKKKSSEKKLKKDTDSDSDSSSFSSDIDSEPIKKRRSSLDAMKSNYLGDPIGFSNDSFSQSSEQPAHKKARLEFSPLSLSDTHGITEELVRRYLSRKPITTTQLVSKFKNRSNLSSEQLVRIIALLLKKINPEKKIIKNKMYLSLKHA